MTQDRSGETAAQGALSGIRVIEFTQIVSGPACGRVLAELGADVIRVEPPEGDPKRNLGAVVPGEGKSFQSLNLGKRSISIDLHCEAGRQTAQRLAQNADVVLCNYRFGVAERLGIDYETLSNLNPTLIYCRITGFGVRSTAATRGAVNGVVEAYAGLLVGGGKIGEDGLPQSNSATAFTDYTAGFSAAIAVCAALYHRRETGKGQILDCSLLRSVLAVQDQHVMREPVQDVTFRDPLIQAIDAIRQQGGNYRQMLGAREKVLSGSRGLNVYHAAFQARDGVIVLGASTAKTRAAARRVLGVPDDPVLTPPIEDINASEYLMGLQQLHDQFASAIGAQTVGYLVDALNAVGCPAAPVNFPEEMSDDPIVEAEGLMVSTSHAITGPQRVLGPLFEMSASPTRVQRASPALGEHSRGILIEAGFDEAEVDALLEAGAVRQR